MKLKHQVLTIHSLYFIPQFKSQIKPSCISTALLKTSLPLHMPPIKLVVFQRTYQFYL